MSLPVCVSAQSVRYWCELARPSRARRCLVSGTPAAERAYEPQARFFVGQASFDPPGRIDTRSPESCRSSNITDSRAHRAARRSMARGGAASPAKTVCLCHAVGIASDRTAAVARHGFEAGQVRSIRSKSAITLRNRAWGIIVPPARNIWSTAQPPGGALLG